MALPCDIGCNIVDPKCDEGHEYTEEVYERNLSVYKKYGIRHIEFSHVVSLDEEAATRLRRVCQHRGIIPWSLHSEHLNDLSEEKEYYEIEEHCARIASKLGISVMVCHLPNCEPRAKDLDRDLRIITKVADIARNYDVRLGIEPCWDDDINYTIRVVDAIDRPDVGITLDTGHVYCFINRDVAAEIRKAGKRIISLHLQDNYGENDDHQMPGLGGIDWESVIAALKEVDYQGPLMMEMTDAPKAYRTVKQLRTYSIKKEIICGAAYLRYLWDSE